MNASDRPSQTSRREAPRLRPALPRSATLLSALAAGLISLGLSAGIADAFTAPGAALPAVTTTATV